MEPRMQTDVDQLAQAFAALANPNRLRIWLRLSEVGQACDPQCSDCDPRDHCRTLGEMAQELGITQPTASHHLKELVRAGLVRRWKAGRSVYCTVEWEGADRLRALLTAGQPQAPVLRSGRAGA